MCLTHCCMLYIHFSALNPPYSSARCKCCQKPFYVSENGGPVRLSLVSCLRLYIASKWQRQGSSLGLTARSLFFHHTKGIQKVLCSTFLSIRRNYMTFVRGSSFAEWQSCCWNLGHLPNSDLVWFLRRAETIQRLEEVIGSGISHYTLGFMYCPLRYRLNFWGLSSANITPNNWGC